MFTIFFQLKCLFLWAISKATRFLYELPLPWFLLKHCIALFEFLYSVNSKQFEKRKFRSFSDYFCRYLIQPRLPQTTSTNVILSPVDAEKWNIENLNTTKENISIKQTQCPLHQFIQEPHLKEKYTLLHFYLSPRNYHRIHSPTNSTIQKATYISGKRFMIRSLNCSYLANNERLILKISHLKTHYFLVLTGAFCVGNIAVSPINKRINKSNTSLIVGQSYHLLEEIAHFKFGSSVSLIVPQSSYQINPQITPDLKPNLKYGMSLMSLKERKI